MEGRLALSAAAAPLVFEVAAAGDGVALDVIRWAGRELGQLANAVIRQLHFESLAFDAVMVGSLFNGGSLLIEPMQEMMLALAPSARLVKLEAPPVVGAVLLGMEQAKVNIAELRSPLKTSTRALFPGVPVPA
jgi:N-acetylglucosamine kinase-like BadF-type ATPase